MRASDADRDRVAAVLREAYAEGRLDAAEHTERIELAYRAKTMGDLAPLLADLPHHYMPANAPAPGAAAPLPTDYGPGSKVTAIFSESHRGGRWLVPAVTAASAVFGQVTIDLREAVLTQHEVVIHANALFGQITVKVPHGVVVRDEGTAVFGSRKGSNRNSAGDVPITPDSPVVIVRGIALFGEVSVQYPKQSKIAKFLRR